MTTTQVVPRTRSAPRTHPPIALFALALGAFGIGLTEFVIVGLLGVIGEDLDVSVPSAGLLVSGYAVGVAAGAPIMTAAGARIPRKIMLMSLLGVFIAGNLMAALAPTYDLLLAGRVVSALAHGAFFGIGSIVAADLVAPDRRAAAIALMFTGLTLANVAGVPLGTALGQHWGWRSTFWVVTSVGIVALAAVALLVPARPRAEFVGMRDQLAVFRQVQVRLALLITALGFGAVFAAFTYFEPIITGVTGLPESAVPWLLMVFGIGLFGGNLVGGRLADRALMKTLAGALAVLTMVLLVFVVAAPYSAAAAVTIFALGAAGFAIVPAVQMRVLNTAGGESALASAANISAFNAGIAGASWLGGAAIDHGFGLLAPVWIGAVLAAAALGLTLLSSSLDRVEKPLLETNSQIGNNQ